MTFPTHVTSAANPRVRWLVELRKRRARDAEGLVVIDGRGELIAALDAGTELRQLYYCPELLARRSESSQLDAVASRAAEVVSLSLAAFAKASYRESPDGWLGIVPSPTRSLQDLRLSPRALVLVCEAVEKPGNLGAMLRTAEAAGVDAVIAASPVTDWGNPNLIRASKGAVFGIPVASASSADAIHWLQARSLRVMVATPDAEMLVPDVDLTLPTAVVVGAEHQGISTDWLNAADTLAKLPMLGHLNSLNVSASAAVVLYEAVRQRYACSPTEPPR